MTSSEKRWPGEDDNPQPDVFTKPPPYPEKLKYGQLNREQFDQFFNEGYVLIENLFEGDELKVLDDCREGIKKEVDTLAQKLYKAGKIKNLYEEYGLFQRLTMLDKEYPGANIILHKQNVLPDFFREVWSHPKLLNVVEQLLGTADIIGDPNWNLRCKTPQTDAATVPWHQDNGYGNNEMYYQMILTGWLPFLDSYEKNGCLQVVKKGHRKGKVATHTGCWRDTWYLMLDEDEMTKTLDVDLEKDIETCRVPYGGILLFSNMLPHRSLNNTSNDIRWSIDIRWVKGDATNEYYGLKKGVKLRSTDPDFKIYWDKFAALDRHKIAEEKVGMKSDEFDTILGGPWMNKWEMVHTNRHTEAFLKQEAMGIAPSSGY